MDAEHLRQQLELSNREGLKIQQKLAEAQARVTALERERQEAVQAQATSSPRPTAPSHAGRKVQVPQMPFFSGEMGAGVDNWVQHAEDIFDFCGDSEFPTIKEKLQYVRMYMKGTAREWWNNEPNQEKITTWQEFVNRLHQRFRPVAASEVARQRLLALRQKGNVSAYCSLFRKEMVNIHDMSVTDQIFHFRRGLRADLEKEVLKKGPQSLEEAMEYAVVMDAVGRHVTQSLYHHQRSSLSSSGAAAAAAANYGAAPMDLNNIEQESQGEEADADHEYDASSSRPVGGAGAAANPMSQVMQQMQQMQKMFLAAMPQRGGGPGASREDRPPRLPRQSVPGLTREDVERLMKEGRCFRCKEKGHYKSECTRPVRPLKW